VQRRIAYGAWKSPITAELVASQSISLMAVAVDGQDIYWIECRPAEGGRHTIVRSSREGAINEVTPPEFYVRSTVHEYGGGAYTVVDGTIYFVNFLDQHMYMQTGGEQPRLLTPGDGFRYADLVLDSARNRLVCIREDHTGGGQAVNTIVSIRPTGTDNGEVMAEGNDFYASARLSPDGTQLAYLTWNHPNMPWDGCELWVASLGIEGAVKSSRKVAGGPTDSIFQPQWSPDGVLHFAGEMSGWWNLYRWRDGRVEALCPMEAEFGAAQWGFGMSTYAFISSQEILCCYSQGGTSHLARLDAAGHLRPIDVGCTDMTDIRCSEGCAAFIGGSPVQPASVLRLDTNSGSAVPIKQAFQIGVGEPYISVPETIRFPTSNGRESHAFFYAPRNPDHLEPRTERPPLIVMSHGGPTAAARTTLRYTIQYWTSRGFGVLDVNYGGSIGYGREFRQSLNGQWGVVDVDDCCAGALFLADRGLVDRRRLAIRGGSAGGYTTLACLAFRSGVFAAGASYYGVADLVGLIKDTHKFESHYLDSLIGPYPDRADLYFERSPIHFMDQFACPIILFHGDEDRIVPPSQSERLYDALQKRGLPTGYLLFRGEQHGFRKVENIERSLEAELYFYSRIFGFEPADQIEPVPIRNV
jgi:dipeptidyl aminopeptidase/acylaminoacyl peptidase